MTPDVHQRINSVTKTFTVTLLLQAEAEGLLSLDDTIDQCREGVPNGDKITLRQMADMTSGIACYTLDKQFQDALFADPEQILLPRSWCRLASRTLPSSILAPNFSTLTQTLICSV